MKLTKFHFLYLYKLDFSKFVQSRKILAMTAISNASICRIYGSVQTSTEFAHFVIIKINAKLNSIYGTQIQTISLLYLL